MKLYYSTGSCSLSPRIALHEAGLAHEGVLAPTKTKLLPDGSDFRAINPKGYVPMLELDDGQRLTEGVAIVQYIADLVPERGLAPPNGSMARYRLQEWLTFISSELHKGGFGVFFNAAANDEFKAAMRERLHGRLRWVDEQLEGRTWLGEQFSVADGYLFNITMWAKPTGIDLSPYPHLLAWRARVAARPAVQAAMAAEGLG